MLSLEDPALVNFYSSWVIRLLHRLVAEGKPLPVWMSTLLLRLPQKRHEARQCRIRKQLTRQDQRLRRTLAFAGRFE